MTLAVSRCRRAMSAGEASSPSSWTGSPVTGSRLLAQPAVSPTTSARTSTASEPFLKATPSPLRGAALRSDRLVLFQIRLELRLVELLEVEDRVVRALRRADQLVELDLDRRGVAI